MKENRFSQKNFLKTKNAKINCLFSKNLIFRVQFRQKSDFDSKFRKSDFDSEFRVGDFDSEFRN